MGTWSRTRRRALSVQLLSLPGAPRQGERISLAGVGVEGPYHMSHQASPQGGGERTWAGPSFTVGARGGLGEGTNPAEPQFPKNKGVALHLPFLSFGELIKQLLWECETPPQKCAPASRIFHLRVLRNPCLSPIATVTPVPLPSWPASPPLSSVLPQGPLAGFPPLSSLCVFSGQKPG